MRRIKASEGGIADPVTGKTVFPPPPAAGVLDPSLMNHIQEEIAAVIEGAGIALDETKRNQMLTAIKKLTVISASKTILVPQDFTTVPLALASLDGFTINPGVEVTINIQQNYIHPTLSVPLRIRHPQSSQILIYGALGTTPAQCVLPFFISDDERALIIVENNETVRIEGVSIKNNSPGGFGYRYVDVSSGGKFSAVICYFLGNSLTYGIKASSNGTAYLQYIDVKNAGYALHSESGAGIDAELSTFTGSGPGTQPTAYLDSENVGFYAIDGGIISAVQCGTYNFMQSILAKKDGYIEVSSHQGATSVTAKFGGKIVAYECPITYAAGYPLTGFLAQWGAFISVKECDATGAYATGSFIADYSSTLIADGCSAFSTVRGFNAKNGSTLTADACSTSGATVVGFYSGQGSVMKLNNPYANNTVASGGTSGYLADIGSQIHGTTLRYGGGVYGTYVSLMGVILGTGTLISGQAAPTTESFITAEGSANSGLRI